MIDNNNLILEDWKHQISSFKKLNINEAKELYQKAISTNDNNLRKRYIDTIILGTLYVVYNYIERNNLELFCSSTFDMNDIISAFNEVWIRKINNGELLNINRFSLLFTFTYFRDVCNQLIGEEIVVDEQFKINTDNFIMLFLEYVKLKNKDNKELLKKYYENRYNTYINYNVMNLFEKIYSNLNFDKIDDLNLNKTKMYYYLKLIINIGLLQNLSDEYADETNMEDKIINEIFFESFIKDVDYVIKDERQKQVIHQRFGLDSGIFSTLDDIANVHNVSRERVRQIEVKSLRYLRRSEKIKNYI